MLRGVILPWYLNIYVYIYWCHVIYTYLIIFICILYAYPISSYHLFDFPLGDIFWIYPCYIYNALLDIYILHIYIDIQEIFIYTVNAFFLISLFFFGGRCIPQVCDVPTARPCEWPVNEPSRGSTPSRWRAAWIAWILAPADPGKESGKLTVCDGK